MDIIIRTICEHFGKDVCESLLDFHAITGKDMTSYFFRTGKVKASKKLLSNPTKMNLIKELGKAEIFSARYIKSAEEFIRSVVYAGEHLENLWIWRLGFIKIWKENYLWLSHQNQIESNLLWRRHTWGLLRCRQQNA